MDIKTILSVEGEFGAMVPLVAYGHTEWDNGECYVTVDHIYDSTGYEIKPSREHAWHLEARSAIEREAAKRIEREHMDCTGEGK